VDLFAVRSSAVNEDGATHSFAGQFESVLGVRRDDVLQAIARVWASSRSQRVLGYGGAPAPMAVVVQAMIDAEVSGVAFGADPVSGDTETAVIAAVLGLGEALVGGDQDADTYHVDCSSRPPAVEVVPASKRSAVRLDPDGGTRTISVPPPTCDAPALTDAEAVRIATETRRIGVLFEAPQDVEWAMTDRPGQRLYILQARPITALPAPGDRPFPVVEPLEAVGEHGWTGERRVWDNSNIVESYSGITSPLTFSFARSVYEEVYRQFCAVVGVPGSLVERHRHVFANMLGLVRGRVYYNLLNWYRTLSLLPGYALNRAFMERMMGVRDKLDDPPVIEASRGKGADTFHLVRMLLRLGRQSRGLGSAVPAFHARVDAALRPLRAEDFSTWSADRLLSLYRRLEDDLLRNWHTPLVNDFFAMIWFGVLCRLTERWLPDAPPTLVNDLLTNEGGIVSTEPARRVMELARLARESPAVLAHLEADADPMAVARQIADDPACASFQREVDGYLEAFGDRCMNELKLETVTLSEDPSFLFQTLRGYVADQMRPPDADREAEPRRAAERRVDETLAWPRRMAFRAVLSRARRRVRDRENLRFERTRVFGAVRRIFVGLGADLERTGQLEARRDIFFLRVEEVFGHVEGTGTSSSLRDLVRVRKAEWSRYAEEPAPPDRFESVGPVSVGRWLTGAAPADIPDGAALRGIGCCPGLVRAPVRIVRDPRDAGDLRGRILVAERTDPGWTLLFPLAEGLLVERGSLLSHSAIVAREVGLPCVVSIPNLLASLEDGEVVEMDGTTGAIRRVNA
jgi:phosphohistidine swiveling domain-containing protein